MQRGNGRCHLTWFQLVIGLVDCSYCVRPAVQDKKNWEIVRATRRTQGPNPPLFYAAVLVAIHKENQKLPASPCNEIMAVIISAVLCTTGRGRSRALHPQSKGTLPTQKALNLSACDCLTTTLTYPVTVEDVISKKDGTMRSSWYFLKTNMQACLWSSTSDRLKCYWQEGLWRMYLGQNDFTHPGYKSVFYCWFGKRENKTLGIIFYKV